MKRFKNNKGVTGVDIAISVTMIIITLGVAMAIYTAYSNKTKEVKRNTTATNLAMKVIEKVEKMGINDILNDSVTITKESSSEEKEKYGLIKEKNESEDNVYDDLTGYTITISKKNGTGISANLAFEVDVTVKYKVKDKEKSVTLSTMKKYEEVEEAEKPNMEDETIDGCIPVKYVASKNGYVKTNYKDEEWYSISSKIFPIVVNATDNDFDRNGVIQLDGEKANCSKYDVYIWQPSYYSINDNEIGFAIKGKKIVYSDESSIYKYTLGGEVTTLSNSRWVKVETVNKKDPNKQIEYYDKLFTWPKIG